MLCFRLLYAIVLSSKVYGACVCVCVCVCVVHLHCSVQLSMFNMEKRYRNKIIIIMFAGCLFTWTGETARLICCMYHSVAAHAMMWADLSLSYTLHVAGIVSN